MNTIHGCSTSPIFVPVCFFVTSHYRAVSDIAHLHEEIQLVNVDTQQIKQACCHITCVCSVRLRRVSRGHVKPQYEGKTKMKIDLRFLESLLHSWMLSDSCLWCWIKCKSSQIIHPNYPRKSIFYMNLNRTNATWLLKQRLLFLLIISLCSLCVSLCYMQ